MLTCIFEEYAGTKDILILGSPMDIVEKEW